MPSVNENIFMDNCINESRTKTENYTIRFHFEDQGVTDSVMIYL